MKYLMLITMVLVCSCSTLTQGYVIDSVELANQISVLDEQYTLLEKSIDLDIFSSEEQDKIGNFKSLVDVLRVKLNSLVELQFAQVEVADIKFYWQMTEEAYIEIRQIVLLYQEDFSPATWISLELFDQRAKDTSNQ